MKKKFNSKCLSPGLGQNSWECDGRAYSRVAQAISSVLWA